MDPPTLTKPGLVLFQVAILLSCAIHGQSRFPEKQIAFGKCPTFPVFKGFDQAQFEGQWFVSYQYATSKFMQCQNFNFTSTTDTTMAIDGYVDTGLSFGIEHKGRSYSKNPENPGVMNWNWDYFGAFTDHVTVIDTDYDNYAILVLCNDLGLIHFNYAILLTKLKNTENNAKHLIRYVDRSHLVIRPLLALYEPNFYGQCWDIPHATDGRQNRNRNYNVDKIMGQTFFNLPTTWFALINLSENSVFKVPSRLMFVPRF